MGQNIGLPVDASSLIYVAKCDAFAEIGRCVPSVLVPPAVWEEAVEAGERIGAPEVVRIREAFQGGFLQRIELSKHEAKIARSLAAAERIGRGESEVLAVAKPTGRCIVDEGRASRVARSMGIVPVPTLLLPVVGHQEGSMTKVEALSLIRRLAVVTSATAKVVFAIEAQL